MKLVIVTHAMHIVPGRRAKAQAACIGRRSLPARIATPGSDWCRRASHTCSYPLLAVLGSAAPAGGSTTVRPDRRCWRCAAHRGPCPKCNPPGSPQQGPRRHLTPRRLASSNRPAGRCARVGPVMQLTCNIVRIPYNAGWQGRLPSGFHGTAELFVTRTLYQRSASRLIKRCYPRLHPLTVDPRCACCWSRRACLAIRLERTRSTSSQYLTWQ